MSRGTRFVEVPADRLLAEFRDCGAKVLAAGGSFREGAEGREVVFELAPGAARAFARVYTSLARGAGAARDCGEDAVRVVVGTLASEGFRTVAPPVKVLRTAPAGAPDRVGAFLERLRSVVRDAYRLAGGVPQCPACGRLMARRESKVGKAFYGCLGYPSCRGTRPLGG